MSDFCKFEKFQRATITGISASQLSVSEFFNATYQRAVAECRIQKYCKVHLTVYSTVYIISYTEFLNYANTQAVYQKSTADGGSHLKLLNQSVRGLTHTGNLNDSVSLKTCDGDTTFRKINVPFATTYYEPAMPSKCQCF